MAGDRPQLVCPLPRRSHYYHPHHSSTYPGHTVHSPTGSTRARRTPSLTGGGGRPDQSVLVRRRSSVSRAQPSRVVVAPASVADDYASKDDDALSEFLSLFTPSSPPPVSRAMTSSPLATLTRDSNRTPTPQRSNPSSTSPAASHASPAAASLARTPSSPGGMNAPPILVPISSVIPPRAISASPRQSRRVVAVPIGGAARPRSRVGGAGHSIGTTAAVPPLPPSAPAIVAAHQGEDQTPAQYAWLLGSPISRCRAPAPRGSDMELALAAFASLNVNPHASPVIHPHYHAPPSKVIVEGAATGGGGAAAPGSPVVLRLGSPALAPASSA